MECQFEDARRDELHKLIHDVEKGKHKSTWEIVEEFFHQTLHIDKFDSKNRKRRVLRFGEAIT